MTPVVSRGVAPPASSHRSAAYASGSLWLWTLLAGLLLAAVVQTTPQSPGEGKRSAANGPPLDAGGSRIGISRVAGSVYLLTGESGNMAASIGEDGVVLVDDGTAPAAPQIKAALAQITDKPVRYIINTHWHPERVGGNGLFPGATIISQNHVRERMETGGSLSGLHIEPYDAASLPVLTFMNDLTLHVNGEDIRSLYFPGHTDGDCIVLFPKSNVAHMGDSFITDGFPVLDLESGGSDAMIEVLEAALRHLPPATKLIPGHGPVAGVQRLREYVGMLRVARAAVEKAVKQHKSLARLKQEKVLARWTRGSTSSAGAERLIESLYSELSEPPLVVDDDDCNGGELELTNPDAVRSARRQAVGTAADELMGPLQRISAPTSANLPSGNAIPPPDPATGDVSLTKLSGQVYLVEGAGINIAASVGEDGVVLVDAGSRATAEKIQAALRTITDKPVLFVIGTEGPGAAAAASTPFPSATFIAQDRFNHRIEAAGRAAGSGPGPRSAHARPAMTFRHDLTLHLNGEDIRAIQFPGTTDGNCIVVFPRSNVVHMGDNFVPGAFPSIDLVKGGSGHVLVEIIEILLKQLASNAKVVPSHGPVSTVAELQEYLNMLEGARTAIETGIKQGKALEQLRREKVLARWESWASPRVTVDQFLQTLYADLEADAREDAKTARK